MLSTISYSTLAFSFLFSAAASATPSTEIRVLTDRTESHLSPIFKAYEAKTGNKVTAVFLDKGLINRLETRPTEADLVITKDAELIEVAKAKKLLGKLNSKTIDDSITPEFRDPTGNYFVDAWRARIVVYSKERVKPSELSSYEDLASPKWKKKICIRSGLHDYNISLFGQFFAAYGQERATKLIQGIKANLAQAPKGNDREQAKNISEGKCDIALMNSYYFPLMATTPEQKAWSEAVRVFFPNQKEKGTFAMRSAVALTNAKEHVQAATSLAEFIASAEGQKIMVNTTFQYPTNKKAERHPITNTLGMEQEGIRNGEFKINFVPLSSIASTRESVVKAVVDSNFDKVD
jgi:iron(III) transport system substrate-binding protein